MSNNKAYNTAYMREYRQRIRNGEPTAQKIVKGYSQLTDEEKREYHRNYRKEWNAANRERIKAYRQSPEGKVARNAQKSKRRAIVKDAGTYTVAEWRAILEKYDYTCLRCRCTDCELTADHVKPLSKGGCNTADNLQPLCRVCNSTKNTKHIDYR